MLKVLYLWFVKYVGTVDQNTNCQTAFIKTANNENSKSDESMKLTPCRNYQMYSRYVSNEATM